MQSTCCRWAWLCAFLALVVACDLEASPVRYPKRAVNEQTVDLTPLFHWWTNKSGSRPLRLWAHVTGSVIGTNSWGWELEAQSDQPHQSGSKGTQLQTSETGAHLILKNPPASEKGEFERLSAQLAALKDRRPHLTQEQSQAKAQASMVAHSGEPARVRNLKTREARFVEAEAGREIKTVDASIAELKKKLAGYPNTQQYEVDCFAFFTGQEFRGMPVYDFGSVLLK
jgi:hypothetical protein